MGKKNNGTVSRNPTEAASVKFYAFDIHRKKAVRKRTKTTRK